MRPVVIMVWVLVVAFGQAVAEDGALRLAYRYPDAGAAVYKNKATVDLNMGVITASLMTEYDSEERVIGRDGDRQSIEYTMRDMAETVKIGGQLVPRDVLAKLEGKSVWYKLTPTGNVSAFESGEVGDLTYAEEKEIRPILASLRLAIPSLYPELPTTPLAVGDTWSSSRTFKTDDVEGVVGKATVEADYKVKRRRHRKGRLCYEIEEVAASTTNSILSFGQMTVVVSGTGEVKSKIEFDTERGLVLKYDTRGRMKVDTRPLNQLDVPATRATMSVRSSRVLEEVR